MNIRFHRRSLQFSRSEALTLIELLVVIAIISILGSLVLPALSNAKEQSKRIKCLSNMRQVGSAFMMYQQDNGKLPPKTQTVPNFASPFAPQNAWKALIPYVGNEGATPVYSCPSLRPHPRNPWKPTLRSRTGYVANSVPLARKLTAMPNPSRLIIIQEGCSLANTLWVQPEPNTRSEAVFHGLEDTTYEQWHTVASGAGHPSWLGEELREQLSNVHNHGGNLIFSDGHADYSKFRKLTSCDFGLGMIGVFPGDPREGRCDPYKGTVQHCRGPDYKPLF